MVGGQGRREASQREQLGEELTKAKGVCSLTKVDGSPPVVGRGDIREGAKRRGHDEGERRPGPPKESWGTGQEDQYPGRKKTKAEVVFETSLRKVKRETETAFNEEERGPSERGVRKGPVEERSKEGPLAAKRGRETEELGLAEGRRRRSGDQQPAKGRHRSLSLVRGHWTNHGSKTGEGRVMCTEQIKTKISRRRDQVPSTPRKPQDTIEGCRKEIIKNTSFENNRRRGRGQQRLPTIVRS